MTHRSLVLRRGLLRRPPLVVALAVAQVRLAGCGQTPASSYDPASYNPGGPATTAPRTATARTATPRTY
jgi:hypothetical protein